jgi:regulatory protein
VPDNSPPVRAGRTARASRKPGRKARSPTAEAGTAAESGRLSAEAQASDADAGSSFGRAEAFMAGTGGRFGEAKAIAEETGLLFGGADVPGAGPAWPGMPSGGRRQSGAVEDPGGEEAARAVCLRMLAKAPRTRAQLAAALRRRRVPDDVAESVLGRFADVGLIDDGAFARAWVESRHHGRGLARRALAAELRQRGVSEGDVRSAVGLLRPQDEVETARRLVAKRVAATRGQPWPVRARHLLGVLARRGYPAALAARVVRDALDQERAGDPGAGADEARIWPDSAADDWA